MSIINTHSACWSPIWEGTNINEGLSGLDCDLFCAEAPGNDYIHGEGVHHRDLELFGGG
jgi:hypothetical protein